MKILIDADGCPVTDLCIKAAKENKIRCILVSDTSHLFNEKDAEIITVSKGADSADFALVNLVQKGDIVITADYGLSAMCIAKNSHVLHPNGWTIDSDHIDALLMMRHAAKKLRMAGTKIKSIPKRKHEQDELFYTTLLHIIKES